ncbi:hypothetical protein [Neobacillus sp. SAB-20_R2A]|uniref:hypothetical protein n=1 Tax=Neobacillus sp. SAB-20_R2A TaxID=3120519 RepID=UPI003C6E414B
MNFISIIIPLLITVAGVIIPLNALNSKTNLGRTFFTDEQRIKVHYFNTALFSIIMAVAVSYFILVFQVLTIPGFQIETKEITSALGLGVTFFLIFLMITSPIFRWIDNFIIKYHIKYKVTPSEEDGSVYILRMHDKDTCICSKNPNAEYSDQGEYMLISMEEILGKKLLEEKIQKPTRSVFAKLFDI